MANPNPKPKLKPLYGDEALAKKAVCVNLPKDLDEFVRSLPNRAEWLREAIAEKRAREEADRDRTEGET